MPLFLTKTTDGVYPAGTYLPTAINMPHNRGIAPEIPTRLLTNKKPRRISGA